MKKLFTLLAFIFIVLFSAATAYAIPGGTYTIPGSYASIAAAITDLNATGVTGPVIFNVAAGYTEQIPSGGFVINITTNLPTAVNTVTFQRSGIGSNPICTTTVVGLGTVTVSSIGSNGDAFFKLNGTDFITFDGIDLLDNYTGLTTGPKIEYGYMLCRSSATDGSKNVTIKNCRVVLALTSATSAGAGIYTANYTSAGTLTNATSIAGRHENIFVDGNTIERSVTGMYFDGTTDATAPYNLYNNNIQVGVTTANTIIAGSRTSTNTSTQYGLYSINCDSVKFNNNTIRMNPGTNAATHYGIFTSTGTNSNIDIIGNNISDTSLASTSQQAGIHNTFGASGTNNTVNIQNNTVANCRYLTATSATIFYIQNSGAALNVNITGNTVNDCIAGGTASSTGTITGILNSVSNTTAGSVMNISNNTVSNITRNQITTGGTGQLMGIQISSCNLTLNVNGNNVNNITNNITATSITAGLYITATNSNTAQNVYNNTVHTINRNLIDNATRTGDLYGLRAAGSSTSPGVTSVHDNLIYNLNMANGCLGSMYGFYNFASAVYDETYNNTVRDITHNGGSLTQVAIGMYCQNGATTPTKNTYGNLVYNVLGDSVQAGGININYGTTHNVYRNRMYNIQSNAFATLNPASYGMITNTSGTTYNIYNNFIQEIKAPNYNAALPNIAVMGFFGLSTTAGQILNLYYNTIYLDATGGANFSTAGVWTSTVPTADLRNNIIINKSTPGSTSGNTVAYWRNSTTTSTHSTNSDRNNYYAGSPASNRLIYYDGTNSDQTLADWKARVSPKDANSVTENTSFVNTSSSPYDLHISTCTASQCESSGSIISSPSITTDFDGNARYNNAGYPQCSTFTATAPDIGADEFGGEGIDATAPAISYTALGNSSSTTTRTFDNVSITDPASGVNVTSGTRPRVYYKKSTDANTINDNTAFTDGWKWVEANGTSTPFDFTITYSNIFGGSVSTGDNIQYFVVAQDLAATPNVAINSGTFASTPASVNLNSSHTPISGTINSYLISATYSGTYTVGAGFTNFPTLTGAGGLFEALNAGVMTGNITASIVSDLTEDGTNDLNSLSYDVPGANYTLRIVPSSATEKVISGNVANGLIRFDGNDYVTIDGNNGLDGSATKYLRFRNTNGTQPTFSFLNDSRRNTITNCYIEGHNTTTTTGTIYFGTTTGTQGNDSNTISNCDLRDRSDATGRPNAHVYSLGTTTTSAHGNDYNVISGCNIYDNFNDGLSSVALWLNGGTSDWTINNNSFYQTATRTHTSVGAGFFAMIFGNTLGTVNFTNNYVGGSAPQCGSGPYTVNTTALTTFMYAVRLFQSSNTAASNITGNTIQNISFTAPSAAGTLFAGIINDASASAGNVNISNNTVGSGSGTGSISVNFSGTAAALFAGIQTAASTQVIQNNTVGSITFGGTVVAANITRGINSVNNTVSNTSVLINNNTVGSTSTANSISSTVANGSVVGIRCVHPGTETITNNTVRNLSETGTGTVNSNKGIEFAPTAASPTYTITNNTVQNFTTSSANATVTNSSTANILTGISLAGTMNSTTAGTVSQNTVSDIGCTNVAAINTAVRGMALYVSMTTSNAAITRNRIYNVTNTVTGTAPMLVGFHGYFMPPILANNMITLTNGETTDHSSSKEHVSSDSKSNSSTGNNNYTLKINSSSGSKYLGSTQSENKVSNSSGNDGIISESEVQSDYQKPGNEEVPAYYTDASTNGMIVQGVYDADGGTGKFMYYNSVYVGGSASINANNSYCYTREGFTTTITMRNNLFVNARTGGTGKHFVISNFSATNWSANQTNYNVFLGSNAATIGSWVATDRTIDQWRTSSSCDKQTWSDITSNVNPSNLFNSISGGNLAIQTGNAAAWLVSGKGIAVSGQNIDFSGDSRVTSVSGGVTDIGADEFGTPGVNPPAATESAAPSAGTTTTYTLWSRTIASIDWGSGGSSYPSAVTATYFSGVNPPDVVGGNYANSYSTINATGTLTDATYDITYFFGDNETYTISTPSSNTVLAKYNSSWEVYPLGTNPWQTQLTYNTSTAVYTAKVSGLTDFSSFALSDGSSPLPVVISEFNIAADRRDAHLHWVTTHELNNKGFAIERRAQLTGEGSYTPWKEISFVNGNGTTNEPKTYTYSDRKLASGMYQYRLKQVDFNGHAEYFSPAQSDVSIGKPGTFELGQNYPNPSNPKSKIDFQMPFDGKVSIRVYDILGQEVKTLIDEFKTADFYTVEFDGSSVASGTYFYRIIAEGNGQKFTKTLKMILVK